jgi:hypothetical protein
MKNATYAKVQQSISPADASMEIILHHLSSFRENDLESLLADYTNESVLITREATYEGVKEIRGFFTELAVHFPKGKSGFELDKIVSHNDMVYIVWHADTPSLLVSLGTDTFVVKDGKISQQTFAGQMEYK